MAKSIIAYNIKFGLDENWNTVITDLSITVETDYQWQEWITIYVYSIRSTGASGSTLLSSVNVETNEVGQYTFSLTDFQLGGNISTPENSAILTPDKGVRLSLVGGNTIDSNDIAFQANTNYTFSNTSGLIEYIPVIPNYMIQKNFFQGAVSALLRFGKGNGLISWAAGKLNIFAADGATLANVAVADALADQDAVTLKQAKALVSELAKKGGMIVADLDSSANPWGENEIRVTADLEFQRLVDGTPEIFTPADGTILSVAKELSINAGYIADKPAEATLYADHVYLFDEPTGTLKDNGAIANIHWSQVGNLLQPTDSAVKFIDFQNNENSGTIFRIVNDNDAGNDASASIALKGSGPDYTNNVYLAKFGANHYIVEYQDKSALSTDRKLAIGSTNNTDAAIEFFVGGTTTAPTKQAELTRDKGLVYENDLSTSYVDRSLVDKAYVDKLSSNGSKKMPLPIGVNGSITGLSSIPENAHIIGAELIVTEVFDGTVNALKLMLGAQELIDFATLDLDEVAKTVVPVYQKLDSSATPSQSGAIDAGTTGAGIVFLEYVV